MDFTFLILKAFFSLGIVISIILFIYTAYDWKAILNSNVYSGEKDLYIIEKMISLDKNSKLLIIKVKNKTILVFTSTNYAKVLYETENEG